MNKQVLLVDDDEEVLALMAATMEQEGYHVFATGTATRALRELSANPYPVVVSDIVMPEMDGLKLLQKRKEIDENVLVVMVTAFATLDSAIEALNNGATSYLRKPFDPPELVAKVNQAFEKFGKAWETRKLIDELRYAKEYNEQVIQNLIYTVIVLDLSGNIKKINNAMESFLGYREEEILGLPVSVIFSEEFRKTEWEEMIKEKKVVNYPVSFVTRRGKELRGAFTGTVMKSENGQIIGFIGTTKNISGGPRE
ncbi:MAG: response regulator [Endomicrobiales bacterium]